MDGLAGIGVRVSLYVQAFCVLATTVMSTTLRSSCEPLDPQAWKWHNQLMRAAGTIILNGCALVISAIIQSVTLGMSAYHGLIIIALTGVTVFSAIPAYRNLCE